MLINDDFSRPVLVDVGSLPWRPSPIPGVERRMLFRVGDEKARATSIVRYAPGSIFDRHDHPGGEEILVLEGVFQDEHGDYPAGTYLRNPPGTAHKPGSATGCTIFVRLWQFRRDDDVRVARRPEPSNEDLTILHDDSREQILIKSWRRDTAISLLNARGLEFLVVSGGLRIGDQVIQGRTWGRLSAGTRLEAVAAPGGAKVWIRDAPLLHPEVCLITDERPEHDRP